MNVYLLWHTHELPDGEEDAKLIGVYTTVEDAERAKKRVLGQPGFRDSLEGFEISRYEVGRDHWTEGFFTITHDSLTRRFGGTAGSNRSHSRPGCYRPVRVDVTGYSVME